MCAGNFSAFWQNKQYRDQFELAENEKLSREIARLSEAAGRTAGWAGRAEKQKVPGTPALGRTGGYVGHKAAKVMKRAKTIEQRRQRAAEEKQTLLHNIEKTETLKLSCLPAKGTLAQLQEVTVCYGQAPVCGPVYLRLEAGMRMALTGKTAAASQACFSWCWGILFPMRGQSTGSPALPFPMCHRTPRFCRAACPPSPPGAGWTRHS